MQCTLPKTDRYISFTGIACDDQARRLVSYLRECIAETARPSPWQDYFQTKLTEAERRGQDELYLVGSQVNGLRELFTHHDHRDALDLLERIEEECC